MTIMFWTISYYSPSMTEVLHFASVTSNDKAIFTLSGISHLNGISAALQCAWATCFNLSQYINLDNRELFVSKGTAYFKSDYFNTATEIVFFLQSKALTFTTQAKLFSMQMFSPWGERNTSFEIILYSIIVHSKLEKLGHFQTGQWWWSSPPKTYLGRDVEVIC